MQKSNDKTKSKSMNVASRIHEESDHRSATEVLKDSEGKFKTIFNESPIEIELYNAKRGRHSTLSLKITVENN
jgi:hypothetical protein